ncbi:SixA phosphatase family protein [Ferrimonas balearica]|uniref:SixA phosphatase family protein n=1 Tax=Ferrimonas balearica TaxID=44012 RepID=UPI001C97C04B|nr:histidine phosphatase family protein [Ferrimonas balearica]MBY6223641.1 histidine phosphatase family protein [Ferrimonas balearica]
MKALLLVRHAKSSWRHKALADLYRPLSGRGYRQALGIRARLPIEPELWLCSPAVRAYSTALLAGAAPLQLEPALYPGDVNACLSCLDGLPDSLSRVAMVSHNPGLEALAERLSGQSLVLKTAEMVLLCWQGEWQSWRMGVQITPIRRED